MIIVVRGAENTPPAAILCGRPEVREAKEGRDKE